MPVYGLVSIWYQEQFFQDPGGVCICLFTAWCFNWYQEQFFPDPGGVCICLFTAWCFYWYQEQCLQDPGGVCICLFTAWCLTGTRSNVSRIMEEFARSALRNTHCSAPEYRLKMLAEAAVAYSVRLLVDAEHTFYQPVRASDLLHLRR